MKEIGGYFQLEHLHGAEYHDGLLRLNLGRTALIYACQTLNIKKLYLPRFLCDSVTAACQKINTEIAWYSIGTDFLPAHDFMPEENTPDSCVYIVNYYGQLTNAHILSLKEKYGNILVDNTHSFFQKPVSEVATLYSIRKYFGLADGAYLSLPKTADTDDFEALPRDLSNERMAHILGRYEHSASEYYSSMLTTAHSFYDEPVKRMSLLTENLLRGIDYTAAQNQRNANYEALHSLLGQKNKKNFLMADGPFVYPFYTPNASSLKKQLAAKKIFVPTYWGNVISEMPEDSLEWDYASHILPLPVDQRYTTEDMQYMAKTILELLEL